MRYIVGSQKSYSRFLHITIEISHIQESVLDLRLPIWRPGRYTRQNFAAKVRNFAVFDSNGQDLHWNKSGSHTWQINTHKTDIIRVEYEYYSDVMDAGNGCWVDSNKLYINPGTCLMYIKDRVMDPAQILVYTPKDYILATTFKALPEQDFTPELVKLNKYKKFANHFYQGDNYHQIVDTPILASATVLQLKTEIEGVNFNFWLEGSVNLPKEVFLQDMTKIIQTSIKLFGNFPQQRYDFIYLIADKMMLHGVEHASSTVIVMGPNEQLYNNHKNPTSSDKSLIHRYFLTTSIHELFHAWNIKKIIPQDYIEKVYEEESLSSMHWMSEGLTSYYETKLSAQTGLFTPQEILKIQTELIQNYIHFMDPIPVSLAQASLESWVDGYEADKTPFKSPNFYVKGAIAFWILDLKIQRLSGGHKSLDDFIKYLDANYDTTKGYAYKDIDLALNVSSGLDLSADLEALINVGESILPRLKAEFGAADLLLQESPNPELVQAKLGLKLRNFEVIAVYPDSPANLAEIYTKDKLVAISGVSLENGASLNDLISSHINGQKLKVTIQRSNTLLEITIKLGGVPGELSYYPKFTLTAKD